MPRYRADQTLDAWKLIEYLGAGGNGEAWRAERDGDTSALKILRVRDPNREAYRRFRVEVAFLGECRHPGVLPLRDASVPERLTSGRVAWLATPVATKSSDALREAELAQVVKAVIVWARTLADLAAENVSHRDVKPENLFCSQGGWVIGDWGLVSYPDKEALTRPGRKVGPTWFIAPEMLSDPEHADGRLADVYSLAKTLWVLAAGQTFPVTGGTLRRDEPAFRLSSVVTDARADQLERLLEDATAHNALKRPSMAEFVAELEAWSQLKRSFETPSPREHSDVSDLRRRIEAKRGPSQRWLQQLLARRQEAVEYFEPWKGVVERQVLSIIRDAVPEATMTGATANDLHLAGLPGVEDLGSAVTDVSACAARAHSGPIGPAHVLLECLLGQTLITDRPVVRLVAGHSVLYGAERALVWSDSRDAPLGSALHQQALIELIDGLRSSARSALEEFTSRVEELTVTSGDRPGKSNGEADST